MVSSGLTDRIDVSQYRLALHLGLAVLIFGALLWVACPAGRTRQGEDDGLARARPAAASGLCSCRSCSVPWWLASRPAGLQHLAINGWPDHSAASGIEPWYLNLFENAMTVQFNHRVVAYGLLVAVLWRAAAVSRSTGQRGERRSAGYLALAVAMQLGLGIWTLLSHVPPALGVAHQAMAATVFALAVWHCYESRSPRRLSQC